MAQSYTRRINLYINGKQVKNDISSVRKEMYKLQNQQKRMTINSREYNETTQKIRKLKGILQRHNSQLRDTSRGWFNLRKAADKFNHYFALIGSAIAGLTGTVLGLKKTISTFAEFDDKLADVMKTTGLTKDEVKDLNEELKKIDTRTAQIELLDLARVAGKLGITGQDEILGFVRAADQISVALGEDLGGAGEAVRELGKLTDIFKVKELYGQEEALLRVGSSINELGMASTANEGYLVEFSKRTAGIAPQAGVSIENILGLAATLDALGQKAEMSSTAYSKLMTTMTKKTAEFARIAGMSEEAFTELTNTDANEAMIRVFEGISQSEGGFQQMVTILGDLGVEGQRMTSVFGALANNTEMLRKQQNLSNKAFAEGTSLTDEFNIKNNTAQAELDKARKALYNVSVELGERLMPLLTTSTRGLSYLIKALNVIVPVLIKYRGIFVALGAAIGAYYSRLAVLWTIEKARNITLAGNVTATKLMVLFTGKATMAQKRLLVATRASNKALFATPWGLITALIGGAAAMIIRYRNRVKEAIAVEKLHTKVQTAAKQSIVEEKLRVEELIRVVQNHNNETEDRIEALSELNKISPEYFGNLKIETINTEKAKEATEKYTEALLEQARVQAAKDKLIELEKTRIEELEKARTDQVGLLNKVNDTAIDLFGSINGLTQAEIEEGKQLDINKRKAKAAAQAEKNYIAQKEYLLGIIKDTNEEQENAPGTETNNEGSGFEPSKESVDEATAKMAEFLKLSAEEQEEAIRAYFTEAGEGAFDAFLDAIQKSADSKKIDIGAALQFEQEEQEETNPALDYAIQKYRESIDFKLALNESMHEKGLIGEQQYQDQLTALTRQAEKERYEIKRENIYKAQDLAFMATNFVTTLMDMELEKAGDNEEKKKEIKKKYADLNFAVTAAQIIADTAGAIMEGFRQLGPVAGAVAAVLLGATGAVQLGKANAQRQKAKGFAVGGFANEEQYIVAEKNKPEWIAPNWMVKHPVIGPVIQDLEMMRERRGYVNPVAIPQYASGGYTSTSTDAIHRGSDAQPYTNPGIDQKTAERLTEAIENFNRKKLIIYSEKIKKDIEELEEIEQNR